MFWEIIVPMVGAFCVGWIARETLDFKIQADRFCRKLEADVLKRKPGHDEPPSEPKP